MILPDKKWRLETTPEKKLELVLAATGCSVKDIEGIANLRRMRDARTLSGVDTWSPGVDYLFYLLAHVDREKDIYAQEGEKEIYPGFIDTTLSRFRRFAGTGDQNFIESGEGMLIALSLAEQAHKEILGDEEMRKRMRIQVSCTYNVMDGKVFEVLITDILEGNSTILTVTKKDLGWQIEGIAQRPKWTGVIASDSMRHVVTDDEMKDVVKKYLKWIKPDLDLSRKSFRTMTSKKNKNILHGQRIETTGPAS